MRRSILVSIFLLSPGLLAQDRPLTLTYFHNFPPFSSAGEDRVAHGVFIDIFDAVLRDKLGLETQHRGLPWARAQSLVKLNQADGFCTLITDDRLVYATPSKLPILQAHMVIVTRKNHPKLKALEGLQSIEELRSYKIANYIGGGWANQNLKGLNVEWTRTFEQSLRMVASGRVDLSVNVDIAGKYFIHNIGLDKELLVLEKSLDDANFHFFLGKESPYHHLMPKFEAQFQTLIDSGELDQILARYLSKEP